jgi:hypothetical protein
MDFMFAHGEKYPAFVLAASMKNFADFAVERFAFRRQQTAFGENVNSPQFQLRVANGQKSFQAPAGAAGKW